MNTHNSNINNDESDQTGLTTLRRLSYVLLAGNLFCLVVMFGPDSNYLSANAKLEIPFIDSTINARLFLIFFPLCLITINLYAQLLINSLMQNDCEERESSKSSCDPPQTIVYGPC